MNYDKNDTYPETISIQEANFDRWANEKCKNCGMPFWIHRDDEKPYWINDESWQKMKRKTCEKFVHKEVD